MKNNKGKAPMNFNQSKHTSSTLEPKQPLHQMYNFMPISSTSTQVDHGLEHHQVEDIRHATFINEVEQNMQLFWSRRLSEINHTPHDHVPTFLPVSRIKKAMKSNEKVVMMRSDVPVLLTKACEFLVMELILRASMHTEKNKRRKVNRADIAEAIGHEQHLAFLYNLVAPVNNNAEVYIPQLIHEVPFQEIDLPSANNNAEVYIPQLIREVPFQEIDLPSVNNIEEVYIPQLIREVPEIPVTGDHHYAYPYQMNLEDNFNHDFFMGSRDVQENIPSYQQPSSSGDGGNLYFKDFFQ